MSLDFHEGKFSLGMAEIILRLKVVLQLTLSSSEIWKIWNLNHLCRTSGIIPRY